MKPEIEAIIIQGKNIEQLMEFYRVGFDLPDPKWYATDHAGFSIIPYLGFDKVNSAESAGNTVIWFKVIDIEDRFQKLINLGGTAKDHPKRETNSKEILATLLDIEGNKIGLIQVIKEIQKV